MRTGPKWLHLARAELGTKEAPGPANNPDVVQYYVDAVGKKHQDEIAWCAAFVGAMLRRAGRQGTNSLLARSYLKWGAPCQPIIGAICILRRGEPWQGHVGFVDAVHDDTVTIIGGNQGNAVTRARFSKAKVLGYRWPPLSSTEKLGVKT